MTASPGTRSLRGRSIRRPPTRTTRHSPTPPPTCAEKAVLSSSNPISVPRAPCVRRWRAPGDPQPHRHQSRPGHQASAVRTLKWPRFGAYPPRFIPELTEVHLSDVANPQLLLPMPPAIQRVKEAVSEIKRVARKDKMRAAEGAVLFLEKMSPALENVDSSSAATSSAASPRATRPSKSCASSAPNATPSKATPWARSCPTLEAASLPETTTPRPEPGRVESRRGRVSVQPSPQGNRSGGSLPSDRSGAGEAHDE
jgi:hypothetical protein